MIVLVLCIVDTSSPSLIEQLGKDIHSIQSDFKKGYAQLEDRKKIGRDAMIIYLREEKLIDSMRVDLQRLTSIEDSLSIRN
tara:strand:+ start:12446 stop:12688 length:243 start_codon:yes stop_codon:yes gene_type:complete